MTNVLKVTPDLETLSLRPIDIVLNVLNNEIMPLSISNGTIIYKVRKRRKAKGDPERLVS